MARATLASKEDLKALFGVDVVSQAKKERQRAQSRDVDSKTGRPKKTREEMLQSQMADQAQINAYATSKEFPMLHLDPETIKEIKAVWLMFCIKKGGVQQAEEAIMNKMREVDPGMAKVFYGMAASDITIDPRTGKKVRKGDRQGDDNQQENNQFRRDKEMEAFDFHLIEQASRAGSTGCPMASSTAGCPKSKMEGGPDPDMMNIFQELMTSGKLNGMMGNLEALVVKQPGGSNGVDAVMAGKSERSVAKPKAAPSPSPARRGTSVPKKRPVSKSPQLSKKEPQAHDRSSNGSSEAATSASPTLSMAPSWHESGSAVSSATPMVAPTVVITPPADSAAALDTKSSHDPFFSDCAGPETQPGMQEVPAVADVAAMQDAATKAGAVALGAVAAAAAATASPEKARVMLSNGWYTPRGVIVSL